MDGNISSIIWALAIAGLFALVLWIRDRIKKRRQQRAIRRGQKNIHPDFPDVEGEHQFDVGLAGHQHHKDNGTPTAGQWLIMKRDRGNRFDMDAIKFINLSGQQVGWVPSGQNKKLAESMDIGERYYGVVRKSIPRHDRQEIEVSIYKV